MDSVKISKFMSLVLRHEPQALGIALDENGWTDFEVFAAKMHEKMGVNRSALVELVDTNPKKRFAIEGGRIRASQGHSVEVNLGLPPVTPPDQLYHGTTQSVQSAITAEGLIKGQRTHVHLSADEETAKIVAVRRKGPWVIFGVNAKDMFASGMVFHKSDNGVWLTAHVPAEFLSVLRCWS